MLTITKVAETATTITLGWTPIQCLGYVLYVNGVRTSNSWDPMKSTWKVSKGASQYKIVALGAKDEGVYPSAVPPTGNGEKLRPWPSVYETPPTQTLDVDPTPQDQYKMYRLDGATDKILRFDAGATLDAWVRYQNVHRCIIDYRGAKTIDMFYGMFFAETCSDIWVRGYDISGTQVQSVMISSDMSRAWFDGIVRKNKPNRSAQPGFQNHHHYYLGSGHRREHIWITGRSIGQTGGYVVQMYEEPNLPGSGTFNSGLTGMTIEDTVGDPTWLGNGSGVWANNATGITIANTVGLRNARQLGVYAGVQSGVHVRLTNCADMQRTMGDSPWGVPGGVSGSPSGDQNQTGDPGWRMPWDTRTSGIGAI